VEVPTIDMIFSEIAVVGSLVGNYTELSELMTLNADGKVKLYAQRYSLDEVGSAISDLEHGRIKGRGVLVPGNGARPVSSGEVAGAQRT
jgi:NAD+-dependent secondary alcohol dehydrogenase Adh1